MIIHTDEQYKITCKQAERFRESIKNTENDFAHGKMDFWIYKIIQESLISELMLLQDEIRKYENE